MSAESFTIENVINQMPAYTLLNIGYRVCSSDPAVKNYENRQYPQFFHNRETLREAITEAWRIGDWKQKKIIVLTIEAACSESMTIKTSDSEVLAAPTSQAILHGL